MDYKAQTGAQKIAPLARLDWCDECVPEKVSLKMHLATKHIGKGCDRDTYSIASQRKLCGKFGFMVHCTVYALIFLTYLSSQI